mmetsp:Transcript_99112/g.181810  ORF Transcript_99112/g.181810 Transcript_99112/m.181810 type:complete len:425 (+) Transcript_99112:70-1344(+)
MCLGDTAPSLRAPTTTGRRGDDTALVQASAFSAMCEELWNTDPDPLQRSAAWKTLLLDGLDPLTEQSTYERLRQTPSKYDDVIQRDLARTLPQEEFFRERHGKGQSALFSLLRAFSVQFWDIGYVQSLNFIVATLINVFPDDETLVFDCTQSLLFRHSLVDFYRPCFPKLGVTVWQFDRLVEGFLPETYAALQMHGVSAEYYAMQWFLTLFSCDLPQKLVLRIWDRFLVAGWQAVAQVGLALLDELGSQLSELDTCEALTLLKRFVRTRRADGDKLLKKAARFGVSHRMLSKLEAAHARGEEQNTVLLVSTNTAGIVTSWSVEHNTAKCTASASDGHATSRQALPRAFGQPSTNSGKTDCSKTVLPFLIHNLDTGEKTLLEDEWTAYVQEEAAAPEQKLAKHCGLGRFWLHGQKLLALQALGKA